MTGENGDRIEISRVGRWTYHLAFYPAGSWLGLDGGAVLGLWWAKRRARRDLRWLSRLGQKRA